MLAEILRRRFPRGVVVLPHAVSDQRGVRILRIQIFAGEEHLSRATIDTANEFEQSREITVDTVRLDDLALTDVGLLRATKSLCLMARLRPFAAKNPT